ncbi:hypothetical protein TgHK011_004767 [Trichoderma gracile]|nr:hypothetical protein TgHK011_004767 [Trichoderma gracile]
MPSLISRLNLLGASISTKPVSTLLTGGSHTSPKIKVHAASKFSSIVSTSSRPCTSLHSGFEIVISPRPDDYVSSSAAKLSQNAHRLI